MLKIAIPNKGRLSEKSLDILRRVGLRTGGTRSSRRLLASVGRKYQILFVRAADIPEFVENGTADVGITGLDLLGESGKEVETLLELDYGRCRLVVAARQSSDIRGPEDVGDGATVATSFPNLTRAYFEDLGREVDIVPVSGATEVTPHIGVADLITDLTETGSTLLMNHLREVGTILESVAVFVANPDSLEDQGRTIGELTSALESVINADRKRYLMVNVPRDSLEEVRALLPGVTGPTVLDLMGIEDKVAVHAVVEEEDVNGIITVLKSMGGEGILVLPIERMVMG